MFSNNSSKASEFFESKKNYDKLITSDIEEKSVDLLYETPYFGKIDIYGTPVYPIEEILDDLDENDNFQALNFVADAFNSLQNFVNFAKSKGAFKQDFLRDFKPNKAWEPAAAKFDIYHEQRIYNIFLNDYLSNKKIYNINCFVKEYINFVRLTAVDIAFTLSSFILSNNCSSRISGLVIDLTKEPYDNTESKVNNYLNDYQYNNFVSACRSHGFNVNKHAPWQLVADLSNSTMKRYANARGIDLYKNKLFNRFFYKASSMGYYNFKSYLWQMYSDWFSVNTTYSKLKIESYFNNSSPMYSQFMTKRINELPVEISSNKETFFKNYGEINLLKLYLRVRLIEIQMEEKYNLLEKSLVDYYNFSGIQGALAFIDRKLTKTGIYTSNEFKPYFFK